MRGCGSGPLAGSHSKLVAKGFPKRIGKPERISCWAMPNTRADLPLNGSQDPIKSVVPMGFSQVLLASESRRDRTWGQLR